MQNIGVIVARFQVPTLHDAHIDLLNYVHDKSDKVLIVLGTSPVINSLMNPLDFETRCHMVQDLYPDTLVVPLHDHPDNDEWSKTLDLTIRGIFPNSKVTLYGGRDSFVEIYSGAFPTEILRQKDHMSGTEVRREIERNVYRSEDFRAGMIHASAMRYPTVYTCVDVAVSRGTGKDQELLLAQKPTDPHENEFLGQWRLIGGFADPRSPSFEHDAARELLEEANIGIHPEQLEYLDSFLVDDWRYHNEPDVIKTLLFVVHESGTASPGDDICKVKWVKVDQIDLLKIVPDHRPLVERVQKYVAELAA